MRPLCNYLTQTYNGCTAEDTLGIVGSGTSRLFWHDWYVLMIDGPL